MWQAFWRNHTHGIRNDNNKNELTCKSIFLENSIWKYLITGDFISIDTVLTFRKSIESIEIS